MIELSHLYKQFSADAPYRVEDVSLTVQAGECLMLIGPSGCGKTSTLKMMNGLIKPSSGTICIDGKSISAVNEVLLRRSIGYVFQRIGLLPHMTVEENIAIVLRLLSVSKSKCLQRARQVMEFVNLDPSVFAKRYPFELSGGQQQRVGVARALVNNPKILLMDEPFAALDSITRTKLQADFASLRKKLNITVVFVTHDIHEAFLLADRIAIMKEGKLIQVGTTQEISNFPKNDFVKQLLVSYFQNVDEVA